MFKYNVPANYKLVIKLDIQRRKYNDIHNDNMGFPDWMKQQYNCTIQYQYHSSVIDYFIFETEKELTWFTLKYS